MKSQRWRKVTVAAVSLAMIAVAACSNGSDDDASATSAPADSSSSEASRSPDGSADAPSSSEASRSPGAEGTTRGLTDTSIKVGGVAVKTSPSGYSQADVEVGAKARFDRANAEGGVQGRTIDFVGVEDDNLDAAKNLTAVRKLVEQEQVFAVVPVDTIVFGGSDFLIQEQVPFFGWGTLPGYCGNEVGFGFSGCLVAQPGGTVSTSWPANIAEVLGGAAGRTAALIGQDTTAGKNGIDSIGAATAAVGFDVVYAEASIPQGAAPTDWSPYVNAIMDAAGGDPPDVLFSVMNTPLVTGLNLALKQAGYEGVLTDSVDYDPALLANAQIAQALEGSYIWIQHAPFDSDSPEMQQFTADVRAVAGDDVQFTSAMAIGYWSADLFLAAAEKAGPDLTVESFLAAANDGFVSDLPGAVGLREFPANHDTPASCGATVQVVDGAYQTVVDLFCSDPAPY